MLSYLADYSWIFWLVLFGLFVIIEVSSVNLVSIWLACGSLAAFIASRVNITFFWQIFIFAVVSSLCVIFLRPFTNRYIKVKKTKTNVDSMIGATGVVTKAISGMQKGEVKVNGQFWSASGINGQTIEEESVVQVKKVEGVTLFVEKAENDLFENI